jgi:hypothetical protein
MRYLDENINVHGHMLPWAEHCTVVRAQCFFWNPGQPLQKSLTGLLRSLLIQLLEQAPNLIPQVVHLRKWKAARASGNHVIDWTDSELQDTLREYILCAGSSTRVFLLIDGLDEFEGTDEKREELIDLFKDLESLENVKICLSSRPWNVFQDAFGEFPQLRLEDLTYDDISKYVEDQLHSQLRFQRLCRYDLVKAESLIQAITDKAAGVFLWVRLVVRELLKGLRDGDDIRALWKKLEEIPADLIEYFKRMMDSIGHNHRQEASALLQIALHDEFKFMTKHPLRLIDLSFIEEERPDFALKDGYSFRDLDLADREGLQFRLDSTIRRLNSRCMGLLECQYQPYGFFGLSDPEPLEEGERALCGWDVLGADVKTSEGSEPSIYPVVFDRPNSLRAFNLTVDFLHRTCRDFLLAPETHCLLHQYTQGPYDAKMFLRNSKLVQFVALEAAGNGETELVAEIASYLLITLAWPSCRHTPSSAVAAAIMQPVIENIFRHHDFSVSPVWFISPALTNWHEEESSFLTLAIDFDLSSYVRTHVTSQSVQKKLGRPILDYILRPRFTHLLPNLELLRLVLDFGADPNENYGLVSVWALFLCLLADMLTKDISGGNVVVTRLAYFGALEMLIGSGAAALLPRSWLSDPGQYAQYIQLHDDDDLVGKGPEARFFYRWPAVEGSAKHGSEQWYAVGDLLERFRPLFGQGVDELRALLNSRNARPKSRNALGEVTSRR